MIRVLDMLLDTSKHRCNSEKTYFIIIIYIDYYYHPQGYIQKREMSKLSAMDHLAFTYKYRRS